ncbi:MAG TPA: ROK family transcriptional regulator [Vicinamibacterales bacterium]|nr:ROK family transcriptional regulator [Vicinamibacterales bacterium]
MRKIDLTNFRLATSGTVREINRRIALSFIRRQAPLSRADLARSSGLQPSTVSAIIDELIEEGWVTEGIGHALRGRRPRLLHLNVEHAGILAVDLRPEMTTVGLAGVDARFLEQASWRTPDDPRAFIEAITRTVRGFQKRHPQVTCEGMGVSLPGRVDRDGRLVFAPNLRWGTVNLRALLEAAIEMPVAVENAASACALAELWFGRHPESVRNLVAVTISEGIGVGLLMNGQLLRGGDSRAGEFGHVTLDENGPRCPCGNRGCWERYASNSAAVQGYLDAVSGGSPRKGAALTFEQLIELTRSGDRHAVATIERMAEFLGLGLAGLITGLSPEVVVIVGEVTGIWDRVGPIVARVVKRRALPGTTTRIVPTDPALQPRLRGAATLVVQEHFGAPNVA